MKGAVALFIISVTITATVAVPFLHGLQSSSQIDNDKVFGRGELETKSVAIQLPHLSTLHIQDYFSDLIKATLGMTVKELLGEMEKTFKDLDRVTNDGVSELDRVVSLASPEIREELLHIRDNAINGVFVLIGEFIRDLGSVLPMLSKHSVLDPSSDIIQILLGKTLEKLVTEIANALDRSLQVLNNAIADFNRLANTASPEVKTALNKIADEYFNQGRSFATPMLHKLRKLVNWKQLASTRIGNTGRKVVENKDFLDAIISKLLGIDVVAAASEADYVLTQLILLFEATRDELSGTFDINTLTDGDSEENQAGVKVLSVYDSLVDDIIRDTRPIFRTFFLFNEKPRNERTFVYDLAASLVGIGTDALKQFINDASLRIESAIEIGSAKINASALEAGLPTAMKVCGIVNNSLESAKVISKPVIDTIQTILESKVSLPEEEEGSENGISYNHDRIIHAASELVGFNISNATETLKLSLESLDELMANALLELENILPNEDVALRKDIVGIVTDTLTNVHITMQPTLDVLLPFLPDTTRSRKQFAIDIYAGTNGIDVQQFIKYCTFAASEILQLTDLAVIRIQVRAARAGPNVHGKVTALLTSTRDNTTEIIKPFIDIIGPIISP